jgi:hypothetical protein
MVRTDEATGIVLDALAGMVEDPAVGDARMVADALREAGVFEDKNRDRDLFTRTKTIIGEKLAERELTSEEVEEIATALRDAGLIGGIADKAAYPAGSSAEDIVFDQLERRGLDDPTVADSQAIVRALTDAGYLARRETASEAERALLAGTIEALIDDYEPNYDEAGECVDSNIAHALLCNGWRRV